MRAGGRDGTGDIEGSTRGPRGPKKSSVDISKKCISKKSIGISTKIFGRKTLISNVGLVSAVLNNSKNYVIQHSIPSA